MAEPEESLKSLEDLFCQFHSPLSDNLKKKQIEKSLYNFRGHPSAWKFCLFFLSHTNNHYVLMFCLDVLQASVSKTSFSKENKREVRNVIYDLLRASLPPLTTSSSSSSSSSSLPTFIRNKMIQLIVIIAKWDWPHDYPDFFNEVTVMLRDEKTVLLGLMFVKVASEELMGGRGSVAMERKKELLFLFNQHIPILFSLFNDILTSLMAEASNFTSKPCNNNTSLHNNNNSNNINHSNNLFSTTTKSCDNCLPAVCDTILCACLDSLCHLLTWIDFNSSFPENGCVFQNQHPLFTNILQLSTSFILDEDPSHVHKHVHVCETRCRNNISLKALTCLCEVLSRNLLTSSSNLEASFIYEAIQAVMQLLWLLLFQQQAATAAAAADDDVGARVLSLLDESYSRKLMDFLGLFISKHLRHFENLPHFHLLPFHAILSAFTFKQPTSELYLQCLELWSHVVDPMVTKSEQQQQANNKNNNNEFNDYLNKHKKVLLGVVAEVMRKILFKSNQSELELIDDEAQQDDLKTELASFLFDNLDLINNICKLYPHEILTQVGVLFDEHITVYYDLERFVIAQQLPPLEQQKLPAQQQQQFNVATDSSRTGIKLQHIKNHQQQHQQQQHLQQQVLRRTLTLPSETDYPRLHSSLKDLATCLHLYCTLIDHFLSPKHPSPPFLILFEKLVNLLKYSAQSKLYQVECPHFDVIKPDLVDVFTQSLASVKVYSSLLSQYRSCNDDNGLKYDWLVETILNSTIPLFLQSEKAPDKLMMAASQTLHTLLCVVRPVAVYKHNLLLQQLFHTTLPPLAKKVEQQTYRSLFYCLILPWPSVQNQEWESRGKLVESYSSHLLQSFLLLTGVGQLQKLASDPAYREQFKPTVVKDVEMMTHIVSNLDNAGATSASKKICYLALEKAINLTLRILPIYIYCPETTCLVLAFFQVLVQVHRLNMGAPVVSRIVQDVIELFSKELIMASLNQEKSSGHLLIDKFLHILLTIVSEPASIFKQFLPHIIKIAINNVYPPIAHKSSPLIKSSLFHLFHDILRYNWRYFFPNSLLAAQSSLGNQAPTTPTCLQDSEEYFMAIMRAIGESFLQSDLDLFRQNLHCLNSLNSHFQLFHKDIFRNSLLKDFLTVLLNVLLQKSHDLHRDDVTTTIFNMAAVDFESFFCSFVPSFLHTLQGLETCEKEALLTRWKHDQDLPTFSSNLEALANDCWCYCLKKHLNPPFH